MFAQVRVNGSLVSMAEIASNRPGTLSLLPNTHGCAVAQGMAVNHLAVQASDLSIFLKAAVEIMPIETTK